MSLDLNHADVFKQLQQAHAQQASLTSSKRSSSKTLYASQLPGNQQSVIRILPDPLGLHILPYFAAKKCFIQAGGRGYSLISHSSFGLNCPIMDEVKRLREYYNSELSIQSNSDADIKVIRNKLSKLDSIKLNNEFYFNALQFTYQDKKYELVGENPIIFACPGTCSSSIMTFLADDQYETPLHSLTGGRMISIKPMGEKQSKQYVLNVLIQPYDVNTLIDFSLVKATKDVVKFWVKHPEFQRAVVRAFIENEPIDPSLESLSFSIDDADPTIRKTQGVANTPVDYSRVERNVANTTLSSIDSLVENF